MELNYKSVTERSWKISKYLEANTFLNNPRIKEDIKKKVEGILHCKKIKTYYVKICTIPISSA